MIGTLLRAALVAALCAAPATAEPLARELFGAVGAPARGKPKIYGSYAKGCAAGLVELPETGPTWQAMRLSRNRNWGHPALVEFLQDLSVAATRVGWPGLYIGDMSQPRGGPMQTGHASHQVGLDADIWMLPPRRLDLSRAEREEISSVSVRTEDQTGITEAWTPQHAALMRAAALDPRVDRIFVAAAVKIEMCRTATPEDTAWLQKIRPIQGHNTHFHVRLKCPRGAGNCKPQTPSVEELSKGGNGCDETLTWWVTDYLEELRNPKPQPPETGPRPRTAATYLLEDLPGQCAKVLASR